MRNVVGGCLIAAGIVMAGTLGACAMLVGQMGGKPADVWSLLTWPFWLGLAILGLGVFLAISGRTEK